MKKTPRNGVILSHSGEGGRNKKAPGAGINQGLNEKEVMTKASKTVLL
jgi:hypothetical protein